MVVFSLTTMWSVSYNAAMGRLGLTKPIKPLTDKRIDQFRLKTKNGVNGCINWTGFTDKKGYGHTSVYGQKWQVHRLSYYIEFGELDAELTIDHLCNNTGCINPKHLRQITRQENSIIGKGGTARNFPCGHPRSEFVYSGGTRNGRRQMRCKSCYDKYREPL